MLEYLARENERLADTLRRLTESVNPAADGISSDQLRELDELVRDARALLARHAADRPALEKRLAKLRENRAKGRPPKSG
jgi:hypothetical protein